MAGDAGGSKYSSRRSDYAPANVASPHARMDLPKPATTPSGRVRDEDDADFSFDGPALRVDGRSGGSARRVGRQLPDAERWGLRRRAWIWSGDYGDLTNPRASRTWLDSLCRERAAGPAGAAFT